MAKTTKWTPGPYEVCGEVVRTKLRAPEDRTVPEHAGLEVARCSFYLPQYKANANLFAASPEMAEALLGALAWEEQTRARLGLPQVDAPEWVQAARAALAKAEG